MIRYINSEVATFTITSAAEVASEHFPGFEPVTCRSVTGSSIYYRPPARIEY